MNINLSQYRGAIIRFAACKEAKAKVSSLLFASVELLAEGRAIPDSLQVDAKGIPQTFNDKEKIFELTYRKVATDAQYAVDWYRSLQTEPTIPIPKEPEQRGKFDGTPIITNILVDEPTWPNISTPIAKSQNFDATFNDFPAPFIGSGAFPCKIHRQLSIETPLLDEIQTNPDAISWLKKRIHFDISSYNELLGGAVLIIPNPNIRKVDLFLARDEDDKEYLVGKVYPRNHGDLSGLTLTVFEKRFGAISFHKDYAIDDNLIITDELNDIEQTGYILSHKEQGIIYEQEPLSFLRNISLRMAITSKTIELATKYSKKSNSKTSTHKISQHTNARESLISFNAINSRKRDILIRYYANSEKRRKSFISSQQSVQWFEDRASAEKFIRKLISLANKNIMFVDPYADAEDLFNFGHFFTNENISIKLLTSYAGFADKDDNTIKTSFQSVVSTFKSRGLNDLEIKILPGKKNSQLHDRFLFIDNNIWTLGNSLNSIGEKAGMLLKLPDPDVVRDKIMTLYSNSKTI